MEIRYGLFAVMLAVLLGQCSRSSYPVSRYPMLDESELDKLRATFVRRNGPEFRFKLDRYGLVNTVSTQDPRLIPEERETFTEAERKQWSQFIVTNADLFGIAEPDDFQLKCRPSPGGPTCETAVGRKVGTNASLPCAEMVGCQLINGNEIKAADLDPFDALQGYILVFKFRTDPRPGVAIEGHFLPGAKLPASPKLDAKEIEKMFIGKTVSYQRYEPGMPCDGPPGCVPLAPRHYPENLTIQEKNLALRIVPFVRPNPVSKALEVRLAYDVRLKSAYPLSGGWGVLDAITGEILCSNCPFNENGLFNQLGK